LNKSTENISEPILTNNVSESVYPGELHIFGGHINNINKSVNQSLNRLFAYRVYKQ